MFSNPIGIKSFEERLHKKPMFFNPYNFGGGSAANMDDTGLLAYYTFEEASGTIENKSQSGDSVGTAGDGTVTGATYGATGILGDCLSYDGTNDKCTFGSTLSTFNNFQSSTAKFTIIMWLKPTSTANNDIILDQSNFTSANKGASMRFEGTSGAMLFSVFNTNNTICSTGLTTLTAGAGSWHMIAVTYDYSLGSANLKFSVDDSTRETDDTINAGTDSNPSGNLTIGEAYAGNDNPYDGLIDEFSIWNRVLTDAEITTLYNSGSGFSIY